MPKTSAQARPTNLTQTLRRLLSYMGHAKFSLLAVGVLASVAAIASLTGTYMMRPIVNGLATGGEELLARQVIFTAAIYAAGVLSALGYSQIMVRAAQRVVSDIRRDLFAHIQTLPLSYFDSTRSGDIMSFFTNDVDTVSEALNNSFAKRTLVLWPPESASMGRSISSSDRPKPFKAERERDSHVIPPLSSY